MNLSVARLANKVTDARMIRKTVAKINAYSIAVAPLSSFAKRVRKRLKRPGLSEQIA